MDEIYFTYILNGKLENISSIVFKVGVFGSSVSTTKKFASAQKMYKIEGKNSEEFSVYYLYEFLR